MKGMNVTVLAGNLVFDPYLAYDPDGTPVCDFRLASNYGTGHGETKKVGVVFLNTFCRKGQAEACRKWLHKGSEVICVGRLVSSRKVKENEDGSGPQRIELEAFEVHFLHSRTLVQQEEPVEK